MPLNLLPTAQWRDIPQGERHLKGRDLGRDFWEALHTSSHDIRFVLDLGPQFPCLSTLRRRVDELENSILPVVHGSGCLMAIADGRDGLSADMMFRCMRLHLDEAEALLEPKRVEASKLARDRRVAAGDRLTIEADLLHFWFMWQDICYAASRVMADVLPHLQGAIDSLWEVARRSPIHVPSMSSGIETLTEDEQAERLLAIIAAFKDTVYFAEHGFAVVLRFSANWSPPSSYKTCPSDTSSG